MNRLLNWLRSQSTLTIALAFSLGVHVALLAWRVADPISFDKFFNDEPLEVILVNARSNAAPEQAQAIAQYNLAGGGEADKGRATSPLPPQLRETEGDAIDEAHAQIQEMQQKQEQMLAMVRRELAAMPLPDPKREAMSESARAEAERRRQLLDLLAEIEKRINEENKRPKKRYLSPATRESSEAKYYDMFRRQVERTGTTNFPTFRGKKLYGELVMLVWLNQKGEVVETEVAQSSGNRTLDKQAAAIVRAAGPFGGVSAEMRQRAELWAIASRFKFTRDSGFEATASMIEMR
ncbi:MAG: energy transducer TonB [Aquabacterium sp.]|jgi:protein TonB|nr:MAG: energy transducer TonB [Aquabacterium sp.]TAL26761.1 MAG: energy transducer TonB [Aquabacterium sp.]